VTRTAVAAVIALAGAGALVAWLRRRVVLIDVDGRSMQPTLFAGDRVLVVRRPLRRIRAGDIVVVENPVHHQTLGAATRGSRSLAGQAWMIKRAVAVPGDPVPATLATTVSAAAGTPVPDRRLLVLGDNAAHSADSRQHGYLSDDRVLGVVVHRFGRTEASDASGRTAPAGSSWRLHGQPS
jgi:signal peptidase I